MNGVPNAERGCPVTAVRFGLPMEPLLRLCSPFPIWMKIQLESHLSAEPYQRNISESHSLRRVQQPLLMYMYFVVIRDWWNMTLEVGPRLPEWQSPNWATLNSPSVLNSPFMEFWKSCSREITRQSLFWLDCTCTYMSCRNQGCSDDRHVLTQHVHYLLSFIYF